MSAFKYFLHLFTNKFKTFFFIIYIKFLLFFYYTFQCFIGVGKEGNRQSKMKKIRYIQFNIELLLIKILQQNHITSIKFLIKFHNFCVLFFLNPVSQCIPFLSFLILFVTLYLVSWSIQSFLHVYASRKGSPFQMPFLHTAHLFVINQAVIFISCILQDNHCSFSCSTITIYCEER